MTRVTGPALGVVAAALAVISVSVAVAPLADRVWTARSVVAWAWHGPLMIALLLGGLILFVAVSFLTPGRGVARRGSAWRGLARPGLAGQGAAREMGGWQAPGFEPPAPTRGAAAVGQGKAWLGAVWPGMARTVGWLAAIAVRGRDTHARSGTASRGRVGLGVARRGWARQGKDGWMVFGGVRLPATHARGEAWRGAARRGAAGRGASRPGMARRGMATKAVPDLRSGTTHQQGVSHDHH